MNTTRICVETCLLKSHCWGFTLLLSDFSKVLHLCRKEPLKNSWLLFGALNTHICCLFNPLLSKVLTSWSFFKFYVVLEEERKKRCDSHGKLDKKFNMAKDLRVTPKIQMMLIQLIVFVSCQDYLGSGLVLLIEESQPPRSLWSWQNIVFSFFILFVLIF